MTKVPVTALRRQIFALIPVYMNVLMMGCAGGWMPNAIYFFLIERQVPATSHQCSLMASFSELGRMVFAIPAGILADKYGRKIIIMSAGLMHFIAWVMLSANTSLIVIYIARFVLGLATASVNATSLISIGEIASPEIRGKLTSIYQIFIYFGSAAPSIICISFSSYYILSYSITFLSSLAFISMFWIMETPSFLISISKHERAKENLKRIRIGFNEHEVDNEFEKLRKYIDEEKTRSQQTNWITFIKSSAIRRPLLTTIFLNFLSMAIGLQVICAYITTIFPQNDYVDKKFYPLISQIICLLVAISTTFYIEKFTRRTIFMTGAALTSISLAFCAFVIFCYAEYEIDIFKWIFIIGNILALVVICGSVLPMNSTIKTELLPQMVKGFGGSLGVISQSISNIMSYQLYNVITEYFGLHYMYLFYSIDAIILCLMVYFMLPESRGKYLDDVQMEYKDRQVSGQDSPHKSDDEVI